MVLTCDWEWTQQLVVPPVTIRAPDHGMIAVIAPALTTTAAIPEMLSCITSAAAAWI